MYKNVKPNRNRKPKIKRHEKVVKKLEIELQELETTKKELEELIK